MDKSVLYYDSSRILTASEIGSYLYCSRSWWLNKVSGYQPANVEELEIGQWLHEEHGHEVRRASRMNQIAIALVAGAVLLALVWVLLQVIS